SCSSPSSPTTTLYTLLLEYHPSMLTEVTAPGSPVSSCIAHKVAQDLQSLYQFFQNKTDITMKGITFDHYTALLRFDPNSPILSNWQAFVQEFLSQFGMFDTVAEAKENLFNLQMHNNEQFTTFIVCTEKEAYKTSWNYNTLWFVLYYTSRMSSALPPSQPTMAITRLLSPRLTNSEDCSKYSAPWVPWNSSRDSNWQTRGTTGKQTTGAAPPPNPAAQLPLKQELANTN
ncbi:hypothetical protein C0993_005358, partial [Termitomyces sp. T159_Od127]